MPVRHSGRTSSYGAAGDPPPDALGPCLPTATQLSRHRLVNMFGNTISGNTVSITLPWRIERSFRRAVVASTCSTRRSTWWSCDSCCRPSPSAVFSACLLSCRCAVRAGTRGGVSSAALPPRIPRCPAIDRVGGDSGPRLPGFVTALYVPRPSNRAQVCVDFRYIAERLPAPHCTGDGPTQARLLFGRPTFRTMDPSCTIRHGGWGDLGLRTSLTSCSAAVAGMFRSHSRCSPLVMLDGLRGATPPWQIRFSTSPKPWNRRPVPDSSLTP